MSEGSEGVGSFLHSIRKGSIEITVQRVLQLRNENGKIPMKAYEDALASLASIGVVMTQGALKTRVYRASKVISDNPPPTKDVEISVEGSKISSLTGPVMLADADEDTSANTSKGERLKGSTNTHKREMETKYKKCVDSIT